MINIFIEGRFPEKERVGTFVYDVLFHYFGNRMKRDVDVTVNLQKLIYDDNDESISGYCDGDTDEVEIAVARGELDEYDEYYRYDTRTLVSTIAHELVHAKQFIRKEIRNDKTTYCGVDYSEVEYMDQPWEMEAYDWEEKLTEMYWDKK